MLKPKKRISKKEIKQDKLVTRFMQAETFVLDNQKVMTYAGVGLVALVIAIFVWTDSVATKEQEASTRLAAILPTFDRGEMQQAIDGIPAQGTFGLKSIVDEYGSTEAGNLAKLYYGNALMSVNRPQDALEVYMDVDAPTRFMDATAYAAIGTAQAQLGLFEEAGRSFEKAVSADPANPLSPDRLLQAATNFSKAAMGSRAKEALTTLKKQYPDSQLARDIDRYYAELASS